MAPPDPVKILLIDDEASFVRGLARLLHRDGYTVHTADNGQHALAQLRTQRYDVILCDLRMPALDGPTLYTLVQQQSPALCQRMIFVTGDTLNVESTAFLAQCGQPCLYKPCTAAEVRDAIQQQLGLAASAATGAPGEGGRRGASMPEEGMLSIVRRGEVYTSAMPPPTRTPRSSGAHVPRRSHPACDQKKKKAWQYMPRAQMCSLSANNPERSSL